MDTIQEMNRFSIRDIENLTGIKAHTIRIWEQRYGILTPKRTATNIRYYDSVDLKNALRIALLNDYGYKISHIHRMSETDIDNLILDITDEGFKLQALVNDLLEATLAINLDKFENLINNYIKKFGIEQTVEVLLFNFLEKIGIMWMTNHIFPAQEHLVSNIIYRKVSLAIEQLPAMNLTTKPKVLLFLPEGEIHDIGLLYVHYLLKKNHKYPIFLGPNSPVSEVKFIYDTLKPDYLYVHLTAVTDEFDCKKYLQKLTPQFPDSIIFASGGLLKTQKITPPSNLRLLYTLNEVKQTLNSI